ncbi:MAG: hypothetical protein V4549_07760 [Bacteroidota bacterium]
MEISNEIKYIVYAQYWGQNIKPKNPENLIIKQYIDDNGLYKCNSNLIRWAVDNRDKLLLRPLSAITDEHCVELLKIDLIGADTSFFTTENWIELVPQFKGDLIESVKYDGKRKLSIFQKLIELGYDLPSIHLSGKTLHEAGLAIYKD